MNINQLSLIAGIGAFFFWGLIPIYWKQLSAYTPFELNGLRVVFSFATLLIVMFAARSFSDVKKLISSKIVFFKLFICSILLLVNWVTFLWAVTSGHVIEASIGYFINPLVNVLLGVVVLKEELTKTKWLAVLLAFIGIVILISQGVGKPWISLVLAFTFAIYGLIHKVYKIPSASGLLVESFFMSIPTVAYLYNMQVESGLALFKVEMKDLILGLLAGPVTVIPLYLFGKAVVHIPLTTVGLIQYIAPSLQLLVGVLLFGEEFTSTHFWAFLFIWSALLIYSGSGIIMKRVQKQEA